MKKPVYKLTLVLSAMLLLVSIAGAYAGGRILSKEDLARIVKVDPTYKQNVTLNEEGNYIDNNSDEAYQIALRRAVAAEQNLLVDPASFAENLSGNTTASVSLPLVAITGDENTDISNYKAAIVSWVSENRDNIVKLNPTLQGLVNSQDYKSLYMYQVLNHQTK